MLSPDRKFQGQIVISLLLAIGSIGYIVLLPLGPLWTFCFAKLASQWFPFFITFQPILKLPHRSRMNPSRSEIIFNAILINITTKITLKGLIDAHGLRFVSKKYNF